MKNYTSLEKMKASDVAPIFTEEKVTAETFKEEVAKGTLYKGFEPPKDATMLKFRYYSPDGTLIEQNNVPVVYDGTGVESVKTYYLLTDKSSGITVEKENGKIKTGTSPEEWSETVKTVTKDKRFLWTCTETLYTNKAVEYTEPCISAVYGEQGERGAMYLGHYANNQAAYEANKPAVFDGDYYLNTTTKYIRKYLGDNKWSDDIDDYTNYRYNQAINDIFAIIESLPDDFLQKKMIWVKNLVAITARIQQAIVNTLVLSEGTDLDGNTKGGVIQSDNYVAGKKGWQIKHDGSAEFQDGIFRGTFNGLHIKASDIAAYIDFDEQELPTTSIDSGSFSIGRGAVSSGGSVVIGNNVISGGKDNVIIGRDITDNKGSLQCIMIGKNISCPTGYGINIGNSIKATQDLAVNIGYSTENRGRGAICIGYKTKVTEVSGSTKSPTEAIAIGNESYVRGIGSICIGGTSATEDKNCIAIGNGAVASVYNPIVIGSAVESKFRIFYFPAKTPFSTAWGKIYNTAIRRFNVGQSSWGGCIGSYQYELCKFGIEKVSSGGFDPICFFNVNNNKVLTITNDSTKFLAYPLTLGCLPIN